MSKVDIDDFICDNCDGNYAVLDMKAKTYTCNKCGKVYGEQKIK